MGPHPSGSRPGTQQQIAQKPVFLFVFLLLDCIKHSHASFLVLDIYYPESGITLTPGSSNVFMYSYSSSPYSYDLLLDHLNDPYGFSPWFFNYTYYVTVNDKVGADHWRKIIDLGDYSGEIFSEIAAYTDFNAVATSVDVCNEYLFDFPLFGSWYRPQLL